MAIDIPKTSINQAINNVIKVLYGGDDQKTINGLRSVIQQSIQGNPEDARKEISKFTSNPQNIIDRIRSIKEREFEFFKNPQAYIDQKYNERLKDVDFSTLTLDEAQNLAKDLEEFSKINSAEVPSIVSSSGEEYPLHSVKVNTLDSKDKLNQLNKIIQTKKDTAARESALAEFEKNAPIEAKEARDAFIRGEIGRSKDLLEQEGIPSIISGLNARNPMLVRGGQPGALIADQTGQLAQRIQDLAGQLEAEDAAYFIDVGYQSTLRNLVQQNQDFQFALQGQRQKDTLGRQQNFASSQQGLDTKFREDLFRRQLENNLFTQRNQLSLQRRLQEEQERSSLFGGIGSALGSIGGAGLALGLGGGLGGAALGLGLGSQFGGLFGGGLSRI